MKIILASASGVRKKILDDYKIDSEVVISNVDEDEIKKSLEHENASPLDISKNLAPANLLAVVDILVPNLEIVWPNFCIALNAFPNVLPIVPKKPNLANRPVVALNVFKPPNPALKARLIFLKKSVAGFKNPFARLVTD